MSEQSRLRWMSTKNVWTQLEERSNGKMHHSLKNTHACEGGITSKVDRDVIIKQAHESFVVLGSLEKEQGREKNEEEEDLKQRPNHSKPFQKIDLSRLRSPNIPFVGQTSKRIGFSAHQYNSLSESLSSNNDDQNDIWMRTNRNKSSMKKNLTRSISVSPEKSFVHNHHEEKYTNRSLSFKDATEVGKQEGRQPINHSKWRPEQGNGYSEEYLLESPQKRQTKNNNSASPSKYPVTALPMLTKVKSRYKALPNLNKQQHSPSSYHMEQSTSDDDDEHLESFDATRKENFDLNYWTPIEKQVWFGNVMTRKLIAMKVD